MKSFFRAPIWIVPLAVAALVALLGRWGDQRLHQMIGEELRSDLTSTLDANVTALEIWATNQMKIASALAGEPRFQALALASLNAGTASDPPPGSALSQSQRDLSSYLRTRLNGLGYEIAHLVTTNLVVTVTSNPGSTRTNFPISDAHVSKFLELFGSAKPVIITPFRPRQSLVRTPGASSPNLAGTSLEPRRTPRSNTLMQVAVPVRDETGVVRGALALVINPDQEFTRILSVARAGNSGETYVFDQHGLLLSRSRYEAQLRELGLIEKEPTANSAAGLLLTDPGEMPKEKAKGSDQAETTPPLIWIVANAVAGGSGVDVQPSRDYRGVPVVGAWRWLAHHGFGVATQMDADEAFQPLRVLNLLFVMLFLLLALCATGLFLASYLSVLWRRRLNQAELKLRQLGQYTLEEKIGEGAMGIVYRARHALMRRDTAVKLLLPGRADAESVKRFEHEVRLSCQLAHPNTIQVYDYGHTPDGIFYYAMELLRGLNLHDLVQKFGPQPEPRVIHILCQVCDALAEAHGMGLVHRDIKPANIFVCDRSGLPDWVKVLDFGLVRAYRDGKGTAPRVVSQVAEGTPLFMPPEAFADSGAADPRSDIYSLGALGYYLATGQYVFEAESDSDLYKKHHVEPPVAPSRRTTNPISAELEESLLRCLEKEPNLRVQSVSELRQLLMTSPWAESWTLKERVGWWVRYHAQEKASSASVKAMKASPSERTVRIQFSDELGQQTTEDRTSN